MAMPGGIRDVAGAENDLETVNLARFAIDEHNKKSNAGLQFSRVVKVQTQVVAGTMHHLTIEAVDTSKKKSLLEAKVWEKPWENFRSLHEIKHLGDSTSA
ncbi:hypothetical protein LUZ61_006747 [Rhynchospora tenuis]|uniref:Cysteine proteinase inhibitor n=1 Tax=Rhynchospora tenuis TaxID=198213 RepID=A0AAD5ZS75_9POAL|nr:hypothetical protein LUZ61_006747 [Rhynchospora tenuis]